MVIEVMRFPKDEGGGRRIRIDFLKMKGGGRERIYLKVCGELGKWSHGLHGLPIRVWVGGLVPGCLDF